MPEEQDDTTPNEESAQETTPAADSSPANETPNPKEGSEETEASQDDAATNETADEAAGDSAEGEADDQEETPPMIPLQRHKEILEKERKENGRSKKSKDSAPDTQGSDGDEEDEIELSPSAQKLIDRQVEKRLQADKEAAKQAELAQSFEREVTRLEEKYDGKKDGLPKFDKKAVMEHGRKVGIYNIEKAYKDLNEKAIEQANRKKIAKEYAENPPASSDRPGASEGAREGSRGQERVDMHDRSQVVSRIRKERQRLEAGQG